VEFAFVAAWLKQGGSIIGLPLQYPTMEFVKDAMLMLHNIDIDNYAGRVAYIQFDPKINAIESLNKDTIRANLLKPDIWDKAIQWTDKMIANNDLGTMVFGSALNLLLFSPTYKNSMIEKLKAVIQEDKTRSYIFSVSNNVFKDDIALWENAADNLMFTRMEKPMKLFLSIARMKDVKFSNEEVKVPVSRDILEEIKKVAETTRVKSIPVLIKI